MKICRFKHKILHLQKCLQTIKLLNCDTIKKLNWGLCMNIHCVLIDISNRITLEDNKIISHGQIKY